MGGDSSVIVLLILIILQILLYTFAFTVFFRIKDRRGPPGKGTCSYK